MASEDVVVGAASNRVERGLIEDRANHPRHVVERSPPQPIDCPRLGDGGDRGTSGRVGVRARDLLGDRSYGIFDARVAIHDEARQPSLGGHTSHSYRMIDNRSGGVTDLDNSVVHVRSEATIQRELSSTHLAA